MKTLIVANWKMNPLTIKEASGLFNSVKRRLKKNKKVEMVVCPPFIYLSNIKYQVSSIRLGGQDCFWEEKGAYAGEISPKQLSNLGCKYVILGHSSRRIWLGETDEIINKKIKATISANLNPIFCIGETEEERGKSQTQKVLKSQIEQGLKKISRNKIKNLVIAYEPVWAVGTGKPCDPEEAQKMSLLIRKIMAKKYSLSIAKKIRIIYGGSINSKNARPYITGAKFQGLLIGGASLDPKEFIKIVKIVSGA